MEVQAKHERASMAGVGKCRICGEPARPLLDLGAMPLANSLMDRPDQIMEEYPLLLERCDCGNFQLRDCLDAAALYTNYNYATPNSPSLRTHYAELVEHLKETGLLGHGSAVLEVGSNVGQFLEFLAPHVRSIVGVDPARNIAEIANSRGIPTIAEFFDAKFARRLRVQRGEVDLVITRHCMAHNKDPYAILDGVVELLSPHGALIIENAYAIKTFEGNEFDQIYHEHMFYFSLHAIREMLGRRGLMLCDLMISDIHGGSFACIARRRGRGMDITRRIVKAIESEDNLLSGGLPERFARGSETIRSNLAQLVRALRGGGKKVYAYGATAKGATLLNSTGLTRYEIPYCADSTQIKQGRFIPKAGVEIVSEEWAFQNPPDAFLLTAWNYKDELIAKARGAGLADVRFILPVPDVCVL